MEVDTKEIAYIKENSGPDTLRNSENVTCQLCLKRDRCLDLNVLNENFGEDITAKCIPELDIKFTRDPKICLSCQTSLVNYYQFLTKFLAKQENTVECHDRETCLTIKSEELDIKTEEEEYDWNTNNSLSLFHLNAIPSEDTQMKYFVDKSYKQETSHTSIKSEPNKDASEVTTYDCRFCSYKAKRKSRLTRHMLIHKDDSEVTTYDCSFCSYKAKQKCDLTRHLLVHKDASEITTYDCSFCSYKTKRKYYLNTHMLIHKDASEDASEVTTYDCRFCSYKAKRKSRLTRHMLIHKDDSEVTTYDCSFCSYKAKQKCDLTRHLLVHKDASEITTYDCSFCSYKTKRKYYLNTHMLIHKDASEVTTYQCALCPFKTKRKDHLNRHKLIH
ncbi:hypothetical protein NQ318_004945 [Aromia moschata]|uniref:C2H2-type domain-containing protein n=1 Tax=Aromia moschata TaxID=1265417 RepID=A0AAV8XII0_9CUCU|nr:hypothetical protein NQ318_004945 [Aromia moschata]